MSYFIIGGTKEERKEKALEITCSMFHVTRYDTFLVEGETSIGINQIRELKHQLSLKPYNSTHKAAIIHPGELLTIEAQNALLKTLEEASETSILILTAPQAESLLPTVVSRCQIIKLPTKSEITLTEEEFKSMFNVQCSIFNSGVGERLKIASKLGKDKEEIRSFLEKQVVVFREILLNNVGGEANPQYANTLTRCKTELKSLTIGQIIKILKDLEKTRSLIEQNINPRLALEIFFLSSSSTPEVYSS